MSKNNSLKHSGEYESPKCEVFEFTLESTILSGGDYGLTDAPGSAFDTLDPFIF